MIKNNIGNKGAANDGGYATVLVTSGFGDNHGVSMQWDSRDGTNDGGLDGPPHYDDDITIPPVWLKMTRVGNIISGYYSTDGVTYSVANITSPSFVDMSSNPNINESVNIGIWCDGNGYAARETLVLAQFDSFSIRAL